MLFKDSLYITRIKTATSIVQNQKRYTNVMLILRNVIYISVIWDTWNMLQKCKFYFLICTFSDKRDGE